MKRNQHEPARESHLDIWAPAGIGVIGLGVLLILVTKNPYPSPIQVRVYLTDLALSAAAFAVMIPGLLKIELTAPGLVLRAAGAIGVFCLVFFYEPASSSILNALGVKPLPPPPPEACEPTPSSFSATGPATYQVQEPFVWVDAMQKLIYAHKKPDGSLDALMEYVPPMTSHNDYDSFQTADFRQCLDKCSDEGACDAAEYFEANRSCHLLKGPLENCVFPSKRPSYFAAKLRRVQQ